MFRNKTFIQYLESTYKLVHIKAYDKNKLTLDETKL